MTGPLKIAFIWKWNIFYTSLCQHWSTYGSLLWGSCYRGESLEGRFQVTSHFSMNWKICPLRCLAYSWGLNLYFQLSNEDSAWAAYNTRQNYFLQKILGHGDSLILPKGRVSAEIFEVRKFMNLYLWLKSSLWQIQTTGNVVGTFACLCAELKETYII